MVFLPSFFNYFSIFKMKNDDSEDLSLMKQGAREVCWEV